MFPPPMFAPPPPRTGGAAAAFKWGAIFGVVAGVVNLIQVLISAGVVNANVGSIDSYENSPGFQAYLQCVQGGNTNCQPPTGDVTGFQSVVLSFFGSCCAIFLLTLVVYLFAARFAAKEAGRRGPGIWAAVIAATVGSILYIVFGIIAINLTGRSALLGGLGPFSPVIDSATWAGALTRATLVVDGLGLLVTAGAAALMGLGGAALGLRGLPPAGYPLPPFGQPGMPPFGPMASPYGPPLPMYGPPGAMPGTSPGMPYGGQPGAAPPPDFTLPAQYPPLPSHYETPPSGGAPGEGSSGPSDTTGTTGNTGNA